MTGNVAVRSPPPCESSNCCPTRRLARPARNAGPLARALLSRTAVACTMHPPRTASASGAGQLLTRVRTDCRKSARATCRTRRRTRRSSPWSRTRRARRSAPPPRAFSGLPGQQSLATCVNPAPHFDELTCNILMLGLQRAQVHAGVVDTLAGEQV